MAIKNFQTWALAFESKRELSFLTDVYKELKTSGSITFPPPPSTTSSHLLTTTTAPAWIDSDVCMRCRTAFTFTNRKHHCRNCGLVFDQQCSSKNMPLPHYGIAEPVRVCDSCYSKVAKNKPAGPAPVVPGRTPRTRQDLDADLQRAIELSLAESQPGASGSAKGMMSGSEPPLRRQAGNAEDDDEQLRLAIEASLREMERERPSAPTGSDEPEYKPLPTFDLTPRETETVLTFSNTLDQMAAYGERDLRRFPHAHVLYEQAYAVGGKLQRNAEEKHTKQRESASRHLRGICTDELRNAGGDAEQVVPSGRFIRANPRWSTGLCRAPNAGATATAVSPVCACPPAVPALWVRPSLCLAGASSSERVRAICTPSVPAPTTARRRSITVSLHPTGTAYLYSADLPTSPTCPVPAPCPALPRVRRTTATSRNIANSP